MPPIVPAAAVIELVLDEPVQPEGKVQVYEVAFVTGDTEYVLELLGQKLALPEIVPG